MYTFLPSRISQKKNVSLRKGKFGVVCILGRSQYRLYCMILEAAKGFEMDTNWFHNVLARSSELFVK